MTAERVYKRALPAAAAERELHDQSGSQFDAEVVAALLGAIALARQPGAAEPLTTARA
jgi:HD-GYP domain-containing protein (c-di-GMP phosphodiesterase class II)